MARLAAGETIAGYRIEAFAGRGGMGEVYRATQVALERSVAVKLITPELSSDEGFRERFRREAKVAASLRHPNVLPVYRRVRPTVSSSSRWRSSRARISAG